jgi:hypothetical protein
MAFVCSELKLNFCERLCKTCAKFGRATIIFKNPTFLWGFYFLIGIVFDDDLLPTFMVGPPFALCACFGDTHFVRVCYSIIFATTPAPTVRPPSRIAKRVPASIACGVPNVTIIVTLSPGITISTPAGSSMSPVTSVVRM